MPHFFLLSNNRRPVGQGAGLCAVAAMLCLLIGGCGGGSSGGEGASFTATLNRNQSNWTNQKVSRYRLGVRSSGAFFYTTVTTTVTDGRIMSSEVEVKGPLGASVGADAVKRYGTVEALFQAVKDSASSGQSRVEVDYAPVYGYPQRISVSPRETTATDGGSDVSVTEFTPLYEAVRNVPHLPDLRRLDDAGSESRRENDDLPGVWRRGRI